MLSAMGILKKPRLKIIIHYLKIQVFPYNALCADMLK